MLDEVQRRALSLLDEARDQGREAAMVLFDREKRRSLQDKGAFVTVVEELSNL
jgi:hypothetical protein